MTGSFRGREGDGIAFGVEGGWAVICGVCFLVDGRGGWRLGCEGWGGRDELEGEDYGGEHHAFPLALEIGVLFFSFKFWHVAQSQDLTGVLVAAGS
jgi:hypothetical protein